MLKPEIPLDGWLGELDQWLERSPGFFSGKPLILDLTGLSFVRSDIAGVIAELAKRSMRIIGFEGADPAALDDTLPPLLTGGRSAGSVEAIETIASRPSTDAKAGKAAGAAPTMGTTKGSSLLVETPVRSGQTIINPNGDVIVLGSVASGAEVVAAGSIHVYGTLRGRALAGAYGEPSARIFCRRFEAELISIGDAYTAAEDIEARLRQKPVQAWLANGELKIAMHDQIDKEAGKWRKS
jgi:septum site-determining protein MinC